MMFFLAGVIPCLPSDGREAWAWQWEIYKDEGPGGKAGCVKELDK